MASDRSGPIASTVQLCSRLTSHFLVLWWRSGSAAAVRSSMLRACCAEGDVYSGCRVRSVAPATKEQCFAYGTSILNSIEKV